MREIAVNPDRMDAVAAYVTGEACGTRRDGDGISRALGTDGGGSEKYHAGPEITADHGAQPRVTRPTAVVYHMDPDHRYRPTDAREDNEAEEQLAEKRRLIEERARERATIEERGCAKWLADAARRCAPNLVWRRTDAQIEEAIEHDIMSEARTRTSWISPPARERALAEFRRQLWVEIALIRAQDQKKRRITKM